MVDGVYDAGLGALFGIAERRADEFLISQVYAVDGRIAGVQRKRHLRQDEKGFSVSSKTAVFEFGAARFGSIICAEGGVDFAWDASAAEGSSVLFFCSAPGLYGRRTDVASWGPASSGGSNAVWVTPPPCPTRWSVGGYGDPSGVS